MDTYLEENWINFTKDDRKIAIKLLTQIEKVEKELYGKPTILKNKHSGKVFLSDDDFNTYMLNDLNVIEKWVNCPNCGCEGFISEFNKTDNNCLLCNDCREEF